MRVCSFMPVLFLYGCTDHHRVTESNEAHRLVEVVDHGGGLSQEGDVAKATNGVRGAGSAMGSVDVFSLNDQATCQLTLKMPDGQTLLDKPGTEIAVFENPFVYPAGVFMDPAIVSVSKDGMLFVDMPHKFLAPDPLRYSTQPDHWQGFAGVHPVLLHEEENRVDPFDQALAGGDQFDLSHLPEDMRDGIKYIRITCASVMINPDTMRVYPKDPVSNGTDIDGVYVRHIEQEN